VRREWSDCAAIKFTCACPAEVSKKVGKRRPKAKGSKVRKAKEKEIVKDEKDEKDLLQLKFQGFAALKREVDRTVTKEVDKLNCCPKGIGSQKNWCYSVAYWTAATGQGYPCEPFPGKTREDPAGDPAT